MQQRIRHKRGSIHGNAHDGHPRRRSGSRHGVAMHGSHGVANGVANGGSHGLARHAEYVVEDMTATEFSDGRGVVGTQVPAVLSQEALLEAERSIAALMTQVSGKGDQNPGHPSRESITQEIRSGQPHARHAWAVGPRWADVLMVSCACRGSAYFKRYTLKPPRPEYSRI
jgi:hypothetical protein